MLELSWHGSWCPWTRLRRVREYVFSAHLERIKPEVLDGKQAGIRLPIRGTQNTCECKCAASCSWSGRLTAARCHLGERIRGRSDVEARCHAREIGRVQRRILATGQWCLAGLEASEVLRLGRHPVEAAGRQHSWSPHRRCKPAGRTTPFLDPAAAGSRYGTKATLEGVGMHPLSVKQRDLQCILSQGPIRRNRLHLVYSEDAGL